MDGHDIEVMNNTKRRKRSVSAAAITASVYLLAAVALSLSLNKPQTELNASLEEMAVNAQNEDFPLLTSNVPDPEFEVKVTVDDETITVKSSGAVSDALDKAGISLDADDLINVSLGERLYDNSYIVINRVNVTEEVKFEAVNYATKYKEDENYALGYSEVVTDGDEGEIKTVIQHTYVDGELVSSDVVSEEMTKAPLDEVIVVGTKEPEPEPEPEPVKKAEPVETPGWLEIGENGEPVSYSRVFTGKSCAYTAPAGSKTSTGNTVKVGHVAVDPDVIPYGSELYIVTTDGSRVYGYAVAVDTGASLRNGSIIVDLFMDTYDDCVNWGARQVNVYVLE